MRDIVIDTLPSSLAMLVTLLEALLKEWVVWVRVKFML